VLFYGHQLAVLPVAGADAPDFADELELLDGGGGGAGNSVAAVANSFVVDLSAQGIREVHNTLVIRFGVTHTLPHSVAETIVPSSQPGLPFPLPGCCNVGVPSRRVG
jgi:hypothetical protein